MEELAEELESGLEEYLLQIATKNREQILNMFGELGSKYEEDPDPGDLMESWMAFAGTGGIHEVDGVRLDEFEKQELAKEMEKVSKGTSIRLPSSAMGSNGGTSSSAAVDCDDDGTGSLNSAITYFKFRLNERPQRLSGKFPTSPYAAIHESERKKVLPVDSSRPLEKSCSVAVEKHAQQMANEIQNGLLYKVGLLSNMVFFVGAEGHPTSVPIMKPFLSHYSPLLRELINQDRENQLDCIVVPNYSTKIINMLVGMLLTGSVTEAKESKGKDVSLMWDLMKDLGIVYDPKSFFYYEVDEDEVKREAEVGIATDAETGPPGISADMNQVQSFPHLVQDEVDKTESRWIDEEIKDPNVLKALKEKNRLRPVVPQRIVQDKDNPNVMSLLRGELREPRRIRQLIPAEAVVHADRIEEAKRAEDKRILEEVVVASQGPEVIDLGDDEDQGQQQNPNVLHIVGDDDDGTIKEPEISPVTGDNDNQHKEPEVPPMTGGNDDQHQEPEIPLVIGNDDTQPKEPEIPPVSAEDQEQPKEPEISPIIQGEKLILVENRTAQPEQSRDTYKKFVDPIILSQLTIDTVDPHTSKSEPIQTLTPNEDHIHIQLVTGTESESQSVFIPPKFKGRTGIVISQKPPLLPAAKKRKRPSITSESKMPHLDPAIGSKHQHQESQTDGSLTGLPRLDSYGLNQTENGLDLPNPAANTGSQPAAAADIPKSKMNIAEGKAQLTKREGNVIFVNNGREPCSSSTMLKKVVDHSKKKVKFSEGTEAGSKVVAEKKPEKLQSLHQQRDQHIPQMVVVPSRKKSVPEGVKVDTYVEDHVEHNSMSRSGSVSGGTCNAHFSQSTSTTVTVPINEGDNGGDESELMGTTTTDNGKRGRGKGRGRPKGSRKRVRSSWSTNINGTEERSDIRTRSGSTRRRDGDGGSGASSTTI